MTDIAHQLGYFETIGSWRAYQELIPRLATVTLDQVNAAARRYLRADNRTLGWFEPETSNPLSRYPETARLTRAEDAAHSHCDTRLPNGIVLLAKETRTTPAVTMLLGIRAGTYYDPPGREGTAALVARVLDRGTARVVSARRSPTSSTGAARRCRSWPGAIRPS